MKEDIGSIVAMVCGSVCFIALIGMIVYAVHQDNLTRDELIVKCLEREAATNCAAAFGRRR